MNTKKPAAPKLIGHPNGDVAASYCHEHHQHAGHWDESPTPYSITITGPIGDAA